MAVLEQIITTNSKQEATIDSRASTVKSLTGQVKTLNEQVLSLKHKVGGRSTLSSYWAKNSYCWFHEYGVGNYHNTLSYTKRQKRPQGKGLPQKHHGRKRVQQRLG